ncbi:MAG: nickel transporter [Gemmatimonadetes bacterium]|nr:nickel transporter [Gemmatimonadota bacterium]
MSGARFRVVSVLDLRGGEAVHAGSGPRSAYPLLRSVLADGSDPAAIAAGSLRRLGLRDLYIADLDAIDSGSPDPGNAELLGAMARDGQRAWVDAGVADAPAATELLHWGASRVVVGLETLPGLEELRNLAAAVPRRRLVFSLDMRGGVAVARSRSIGELGPARLVREAAQAGYGTIIVLDLDRVGRGLGPDLPALAVLRDEAPALCWLVGGGVRSPEDLRGIAAIGFAGALVGTAIHEGTIRREDLEAEQLHG